MVKSSPERNDLDLKHVDDEGPNVLKLRPEALYAFLYPVRTRQGPNRL